MLLNDILKLKYPSVDFTTQIILQDDGQGCYIKEWNLPDSKPTQALLDQWAVDLQQQYQFAQNKLKNLPIYQQLEAIDLRSMRAMRVNDTQRLQALEQDAINLRNQLLPVS